MRIIFVDDDTFFSRGYVEALKQEFTVEYVKKADTAIKLISSDGELAAVVLDIMMPIPAGIPKSVVTSFVNTGFYVLRMIRPVMVARSLPVILLTNRKPADVENRVKTFNRDLRRDTARKFDQVTCQHKPSCQAREICSVVNSAINDCE